MIHKIALACASLLLVGCASSRIAVRHGPGPYDELYSTDTGYKFSPQGFNYIVLAGTPSGHSTFDPGIYDPLAADTALQKMLPDGYNAVRVFLDFRGSVAPGQYGMAGPSATIGLYGPYLDNLADFLKRAWLFGMHVIVTMDMWVPQNDYFNAIFTGGAAAGIEDVNSLYLSPGGVAAHAEEARLLVKGMKDRDPNLLTYVMAWELVNEAAVVTDKLPFSQSAGTVLTADGNTYDLSDPVSRLACMDNNFNNWANASAEVIRSIDPDALVSMSVFTNAAVGRTQPGPAQCAASCDTRAPARPLALRTGSTLSYTDVHSYPTSTLTIEQDMATSEVGTPAFKETRQPLLMGEFGIFKDRQTKIGPAINVATWWRSEAAKIGVTGALFWAWDTSLQPTIWGADEDSFALEGALAPTHFIRTKSTVTGLHGVEVAGFAITDYNADAGVTFTFDRTLARTGWTNLYLCNEGGNYFLQPLVCGKGLGRPWAGPIGSISPAPLVGATPLYRCSHAIGKMKDEFLSRDPGCETIGVSLGLLGYAPP